MNQLWFLCLVGATAWPVDQGSVSWGNHRYALAIPEGAASHVAFTADIEWRRSGSDANVSKTAVLFAATLPSVPMAQIFNVSVLSASRLGATVAVDARMFPPGTKVHAYYLPFTRANNVYNEQVTYLPNNKTCTSCCEFEHDVDYSGHDLTSTSLTSPAACCQLCLTTPLCAFWSFAPGFHQCYLKTSGEGRVHVAEMVSGSKSGAHRTDAWLKELQEARSKGQPFPHSPADEAVYEARDDFSAFTAMERTATAAETGAMLSAAPLEALLFPEPRSTMIRMTWRQPTSPDLPEIPVKWAEDGPSDKLAAGEAMIGEYLTFQIGVFAARRNISGIGYSSTPFVRASTSSIATGVSGGTIPAAALTCFNLEGVDEDGSSFERTYAVPYLQTGALWFGLDIPSLDDNVTITAGIYRANITLVLQLDGSDTSDGSAVVQRAAPSAVHESRQTVEVTVDVSSDVAAKHGDGDLKRLTRTRWLNSKAGQTAKPAQRFSPMVVVKSIRSDGDEESRIDGDGGRARVSNWAMDVILDSTGLPSQMTSRVAPYRSLLLNSSSVAGESRATSSANGIDFQITAANGSSEIRWNCPGLNWTSITAELVSWRSDCTAAVNGWSNHDPTVFEEPTAETNSTDDREALLVRSVFGSFEVDGTIQYTVNLSSTSATATDATATGATATGADVTVHDVQLLLPLNAKSVPYLMGLGKGGNKIVPWKWNWNFGQRARGLANNQFWVGGAEQGVRVKLVGDTPDWGGGLHSIRSAKDVPEGWGGEATGKSNVTGGLNCTAPNCTLYSGGMGISPAAHGNKRLVEAVAYRNAPLKLSKTPVSFKFEMLITPCVQLNTSAHFGAQGRYFQFESQTTTAAQLNASYFLDLGAKIVNAHQGNSVLNPFINYPFEPESVVPLTSMTEALHKAGGKMKLYYTTRELSDHAQEIWFLRALGGEILDAPGGEHAYREVGGSFGGGSWMQEHLHSNYSVSWSTPNVNLSRDGMMDNAIGDTKTFSRWNNYYVAGLEWLVSQPPHIDGLYLDGVAFDRLTMKRCRKVMDAVKDGCLIDMHSGDNFNPAYGDVSPALQYMMLMPYMDSLMLGEGYQPGYDAPAGEVDGIVEGGPEHYLVEVSGIPFGLMNDMLGQV
jgi:hypothetical protein